MKGIKARIIGTAFETTVIPYFPEGMFAGFTDVTGNLQPGMVVYKPSDLEFLETPPKLKPEVDWDAFRREAAKGAMCGMMADAHYWKDVWSNNGHNDARSYPTLIAHFAVACADRLTTLLRLKENATEESEKSMVQRKV